MGFLSFIIFGRKTRDKDYGPAYPAHCQRCDNDSYFHALKWRSWFHIFWIPLIPWRANHALICPVCGEGIELEKLPFERATTMADLLEGIEEGTATEEEYLEELHTFEGVADFVEQSADAEPVDVDDAPDPDVENTANAEA